MESRRYYWGVLLLALAGCPADRAFNSPGDAPEDELEQLAWLTGSWVSESDDGSSEEHWTAPRGGSMLGMNRTIKGGKMTFFEFFRIQKRADDIAYLAYPAARSPATVFLLKESGPQRVVFENPQHDNPKKIIYWREGDTLHARTEGTENSKEKSSEWSWQLRK